MSRSFTLLSPFRSRQTPGLLCGHGLLAGDVLGPLEGAEVMCATSGPPPQSGCHGATATPPRLALPVPGSGVWPRHGEEMVAQTQG